MMITVMVKHEMKSVNMCEMVVKHDNM